MIKNAFDFYSRACRFYLFHLPFVRQNIRKQLASVTIFSCNTFQVKIQGQNAEMLLSACEQFLGKSEQEIQHIALVTLEGHQRAIMGSMTVEEIYKDRKIFSKKVSNYFFAN